MTQTAAAKSATSPTIRCATSSTASRSNPPSASMPPRFQVTAAAKNSTAWPYYPLTAGPPRSATMSTCAGYWHIPLSERCSARPAELNGLSIRSIMIWVLSFGRLMPSSWGKGRSNRIQRRSGMVGYSVFLTGKELTQYPASLTRSATLTQVSMDTSIDDLRHGRVSATKLVYRIADTPGLN